MKVAAQFRLDDDGRAWVTPLTRNEDGVVKEYEVEFVSKRGKKLDEDAVASAVDTCLREFVDMEDAPIPF